MDKIKQAGMLEVWVAGVGFRLRRRSTLVMAEARGLMAVAGQIAGANAPQTTEVSEATAADMIRSVLEVAITEVYDASTKEDGEGHVGWLCFQDYFTIDELEPFTDALFTAFMGSSLSVDPTPPSCVA
jgi:hypothetical protein